MQNKRTFSQARRNEMSVFRNTPEIKWADVGMQETAPGNPDQTTTGIGFSLLNGVAEGTGPTQRIGRKIFMRNIQITGMWKRNPEADADFIVPEHTVNWAIVYDRQPTGAKPAFTDIFEIVDTDGATQSSGFVFKNLFNDQRFLFLKHDKFFVPQLIPGDNSNFWDLSAINGAGTASGFSWATGFGPGNNGRSSPCMEVFLPINMETNYNASTSAVGSISTGALWLVMWSAVAVGVATDPMPLHLLYTFRLRFEDKT
jgi:hypothetical protein